ncbi:MAG: DUF4422 domain-containing protein [Lachnospiraceae bacterium]|nr:DUF4422 domain-containing protein [Lachnospiraceae bacterium]
MINSVYVFGCHSRGRTTAKYLTTIKPEKKIEAFLFNNNEENPDNINGIPVIDINSLEPLNTQLPVYVGIRSDNWENVTDTLKSLGFNDIIVMDVATDNCMRNEFFKQEFAGKGESFVKFEDLSLCRNGHEVKGCIYSMISAFDKDLITDYCFPEYEEPMQVGTELATRAVDITFGKPVSYRDNDTSDNISALNREFCELTGMYSIWKRDKSKFDYVGLSHYRRHFILPDDWMQVAYSNNVDVILATPLFLEPSIDENYRFRHISSDLDYVYEHIEKNDANMGCAFREFMQQGIFSPCNMIIARNDIFNELCEWMFPILLSLHEKVGKREDKYQNRYPGFISERLISFYFDYFKDKYYRVYADKYFIK